MTLTELEALIDASTLIRVETVLSTTTMDPAQIKQLIALCRMQHEALRTAEEFIDRHSEPWYLSGQADLKKTREALIAYWEFVK